MKTNYLIDNIRWQFNQNPFVHLLGASTTEKRYYEQLEKLTSSYFPQNKQIDTRYVEFCLNKIALLKPKNDAEKVALEYFSQFWSQFVRSKKLFDKDYLTFPADNICTKIENISALFAKCTQFAVDDNATARIVARTEELAELTEKETRYLPEVLRLTEVKYYCATTLSLFAEKPFAEAHSARFLRPSLLKQNFSANKLYCQNSYVDKQLTTVADCLGSSVAKFRDKPIETGIKLFVYANGRNVFDTFCQSKFGQRTAEFRSVSNTVEISMRYFVRENSEIRNVTLRNNGARARKFTVQIPLAYYGSQSDNYFRMDNVLCVASQCFVGVAVLSEHSIVDCVGEKEQLFDIVLPSHSKACFDIVTIYSADTPSLAETIAQLERFGATRCPYLCDRSSTRLAWSQIDLSLTPHGYTSPKPPKKLSRQINYTYQLGDADVATFVDNGGNTTTLLRGFVFGVGGESVYSVANGYAKKLNEREFKLETELCYCKENSKLTISHDKHKIYRVEHVKPCKTLFYFPLEKTSQITFEKESQTFLVSDSTRKYSLACVGKVESFTTNAIECNEEKLRYKLSGDLKAGRCLAVCFATSSTAELHIIPQENTPLPSPIVRESLVSTYLNYVNEKSVFCLNNFLKRPDCLTLSAICYTNPQFVRRYIETIVSNGSADTFYYDATGTTKSFCDKLALPLSVIYYLNLVGELPAETVKQAFDVLWKESFEGKELCIKALALIKSVNLNCADKVRCLVEYNKLKKQISSDSKLFAYAQAIGALPLSAPSKERLKDLCNKYDVPKNWYYVSQLENLYGLSISAGRLHIAPKVTAPNVLEQLALNIAGKRIDTSFAKASVQSMTLNGVQYFQPFYAPSLKQDNNELVVRY